MFHRLPMSVNSQHCKYNEGTIQCFFLEINLVPFTCVPEMKSIIYIIIIIQKNNAKTMSEDLNLCLPKRFLKNEIEVYNKLLSLPIMQCLYIVFVTIKDTLKLKCTINLQISHCTKK